MLQSTPTHHGDRRARARLPAVRQFLGETQFECGFQILQRNARAFFDSAVQRLVRGTDGFGTHVMPHRLVNYQQHAPQEFRPIINSAQDMWTTLAAHGPEQRTLMPVSLWCSLDDNRQGTVHAAPSPGFFWPSGATVAAFFCLGANQKLTVHKPTGQRQEFELSDNSMAIFLSSREAQLSVSPEDPKHRNGILVAIYFEVVPVSQ